MSLNIGETESSGDASPDPDLLVLDRVIEVEPSLPANRDELVAALLAELTSWSPREFIFSFRRLHKGTISLVHLNVLTLLESEGPMPMGKLADALDVSVASLTGIVTRMEARGLVERIHADHDRRVVLVRQTDDGAGVFQGIDKYRRIGLSRLMTRLTDQQIAGLLAGHRALRAARAATVHDDLASASQSPAATESPAGATDDRDCDEKETAAR